MYVEEKVAYIPADFRLNIQQSGGHISFQLNNTHTHTHTHTHNSNSIIRTLTL